MNNPQNNSAEWEKEFDKKWNNNVSYKIGYLDNYQGGKAQCAHNMSSEHRKARKILKSFISSLLSRETERARKEIIEMIEKRYKTIPPIHFDTSEHGYNEALSDIISALKNKQ